MNHICFVTWAVTVNTEIQEFVISFAVRKWRSKFLLLTSFLKLGWKPELCASKLRLLGKFWTKWEVNQQLSFWIIQKSELFSAVSEEISAETGLFQRWFLALKISVFSAVQSWISAVQRFSGNEQRWNRPESILNQSWSALNVSETSTRVLKVNLWNFVRLQSKEAYLLEIRPVILIRICYSASQKNEKYVLYK